MDRLLQTVVELPEYIKQAGKLIDEAARHSFINFIAEHPAKGDLITGTGGARKIRWKGPKHKGKSGGIRIIYYYHSQEIPIFLLTAYGKGQKANLSKDERNELKHILDLLVNTYNEVTYE